MIALNFALHVATVNEDYTSLSAFVEFSPGETEKQVEVNINNDAVFEDNETFQLYLLTTFGTSLIQPTRTIITILNDDIGKCNNPP